MFIFAGLKRNACFFSYALEILMKYRAARTGLDCAERPASFPRRFFTRDSDIVQQPVVERAQVMPPLPATKPKSYCRGAIGEPGLATWPGSNRHEPAPE
jgi:hypothetical protein